MNLNGVRGALNKTTFLEGQFPFLQRRLLIKYDIIKGDRRFTLKFIAADMRISDTEFHAIIRITFVITMKTV